MIGRSRCDKQYQMTNKFAIHIMSFLKNNNITFQQFAKDIKVNEYLLRKVIDRRIKMSCYLTLLKRIAEYTQANDIILGMDSPTITGIRG